MSVPLAAGPSPAWLLRHALRLRGNPLSFFHSLADEFGDFVRFRMGKTNFHLVSDPDLIKEILITRGTSFEKFPRIARSQGLFGDGLLTSEAPFHTRQRRLVQPAFHRDRMAAYSRTMAECAANVCSVWREGETVDMAAEMNRLALAIVSRTLFSANTDAVAGEISSALDVVLHTLNRLMLPPGPQLLSLPLPATRRYRAALGTLDRIIYGLIEQRRRSGQRHDDLLGLLMDTEDAETGERMSDLQLRDEVMTLFVAGHDTTANGLAWTWHLLSNDLECQERVREEVRRVVGMRLPEAADCASLTFTESVIAESLRLYPPVWILGRRPVGPVTVAGETVGSESVFLVCMSVLHRRPGLYPEPERFDASRFEPGRREGRHRFAYLPFGAGSRVCVGERFAWLEMALCVAVIAGRWRMTPVEAPPVEPLALLTLRPKHGLPMRLHRAE